MTTSPLDAIGKRWTAEYPGEPLVNCEVIGPRRGHLPETEFLLENRTPRWSEPLACCVACQGVIRIPPTTTVWDDWTLEQLVYHYMRDHADLLPPEVAP